MRDLVMRGVEPSYPYYAIDEHPIVKEDKEGGKRVLGHMLLVSERPGSIVIDGTVSLYNRFRHGFRLAVRPGVPIESRGHFFDVLANQIYPMTPL